MVCPGRSRLRLRRPFGGRFSALLRCAMDVVIDRVVRAVDHCFVSVYASPNISSRVLASFSSSSIIFLIRRIPRRAFRAAVKSAASVCLVVFCDQSVLIARSAASNTSVSAWISVIVVFVLFWWCWDFIGGPLSRYRLLVRFPPFFACCFRLRFFRWRYWSPTP